MARLRSPRQNPETTGRQCHRCQQWVAPGDAHDCCTTTEAALTKGLSEDLREAWERLRETAADRRDMQNLTTSLVDIFVRAIER